MGCTEESPDDRGIGVCVPTLHDHDLESLLVRSVAFEEEEGPNECNLKEAHLLGITLGQTIHFYNLEPVMNRVFWIARKVG